MVFSRFGFECAVFRLLSAAFFVFFLWFSLVLSGVLLFLMRFPYYSAFLRGGLQTYGKVGKYGLERAAVVNEILRDIA